MRVLSLIHAADADSGLFGETVRSAGHVLDERSYPLGSAPQEPLVAYDAVMVFGGDMNVHEVEAHPWIQAEIADLRAALAGRVPTLGICLGGQLLAAAAGAAVTPVEEPEIGWYDVELTSEADEDPLFGDLRERSSFTAYQWHSYQFALPRGAVPLARSPAGLQAFRVGEVAWGLQFHPEVTIEIVRRWVAEYGSVAGEPRRVEQELERNITRWNELGEAFCRSFLTWAEAAEASRLT